jgi:hypothetical protein
LPSWFDCTEETFVLQDPLTQQEVRARTELGETGFLVAHWPDNSVTQSDVSNLALRVAANVKMAAASKASEAAAAKELAKAAKAERQELAAVLKRPAAASSRRPAAAPASVLLAPASPAPASPAPVADLPPPAPAVMQRPAAAVPAVAAAAAVKRLESPLLGKLQKFCNHEKAYIQHWNTETNSWKSVVNITAKHCYGRQASMIQTLLQLALTGATIADVRARKEELTAAELAAGPGRDAHLSAAELAAVPGENVE